MGVLKKAVANKWLNVTTEVVVYNNVIKPNR